MSFATKEQLIEAGILSDPDVKEKIENQGAKIK